MSGAADGAAFRQHKACNGIGGRPRGRDADEGRQMHIAMSSSSLAAVQAAKPTVAPSDHDDLFPVGLTSGQNLPGDAVGPARSPSAPVSLIAPSSLLLAQQAGDDEGADATGGYLSNLTAQAGGASSNKGQRKMAVLS